MDDNKYALFFVNTSFGVRKYKFKFQVGFRSIRGMENCELQGWTI